MSKYTPGPWKARETRVYFPAMAGGFDISGCPNAEANALLIAAAPELLEALELLLSYTLACEAMLNAKPAGQIDVARVAIAKATGEHHDN